MRGRKSIKVYTSFIRKSMKGANNGVETKIRYLTRNPLIIQKQTSVVSAAHTDSKRSLVQPVTPANIFQPQQQLLCHTHSCNCLLISKQLGKCHSEMLVGLNWLDKCDQRTSINRSCGTKRLESELRGGLAVQAGTAPVT